MALHEALHGCLVACLDWDINGTGHYYICTRQLMSPEQAEEYASHIPYTRRPVVIYDNIDWELRPIKVKQEQLKNASTA